MPENDSQNESSLYFLSTQIQSRHEDQERVDSSLQKLHRFKNASECSKRPVVQDMKVKKSKKPKAPSKSRKITSISAFVRETLGNKKISNTQGILDYFTGDASKMNDFIHKIETATTKPHLLSRRSAGNKSNVLFSEAEWKAFVEKLQLRFPNLSGKNKKSLKAVTRQLNVLRSLERSSSDNSDSASGTDKKIWTQASRQPSSEMTSEDIRWLYDLDEDSNDTSGHDHESTCPEQSCFTLSQVLGESQNHRLSHNESFSAPHESYSTATGASSQHGEIVEDSEPGMEEIPPGKLEEYMTELPISPFLTVRSREQTPLTPEQNSNATTPEKPSVPATPVRTSKPVTTYRFEKENKTIPSHQNVSPNTCSVDVLTSIAFAPTCDFGELGTHSGKSPQEVMTVDSPVEEGFKTPNEWPDHLQISSSPLSSKRRHRADSKSHTNLSPLRNQYDKKADLPSTPQACNANTTEFSDVVEFHGQVELTERSKFILKPLPVHPSSKQSGDHVSDSEDDEEVSFIGVIKPVDLASDLMKPAARARSFLQVPSSP